MQQLLNLQQLLKIAATFKIAAEVIKNCSRNYQNLQQLLKLQQKLSKIAATFKIAAEIIKNCSISPVGRRRDTSLDASVNVSEVVSHQRPRTLV